LKGKGNTKKKGIRGREKGKKKRKKKKREK